MSNPRTQPWDSVDFAEVERRLDAGDAVNTVAADLGVAARTVRNRLHAAGLPLAKQRRRLQQLGWLQDSEWLRDQYVVQERAPSAIAEVLSVSTTEVLVTLESFDIERPPARPELTGPALTAAFENGATVSSIARGAGVDRTAVRHAMRASGVENPHAHRGERPVVLNDDDWLQQRYVIEGRSIESIAAELGSAHYTVRAALARLGIAIRVQTVLVDRIDVVWLRQRYEVDRAALPQIAQEAGASESTLRRAIARHGIALRAPNRRVARSDSYLPGGLDPAWLRQRYTDDGATLGHIAEERGVHPSTVRRALRHHDIRRDVERTRSQQVDPDWLRQRYEVDQVPLRQIAEESGIRAEIIHRTIREYAIPPRPGLLRGRKNWHPHTEQPGGLDPGWLRRRYVREHVTLSSIATEAGVSTTTVHRAVRYHGLVRCTVRRGAGALADAEWLRNRVAEGATAADIGTEVGVSTSTAHRAIRHHGSNS